ncbi:UDP-N-acetylmuramate--L-alanine ligase [Clostridium sp. E02]|uniref:UDP-N-acetylmuramate--L-alanine ligase n=1 Tax=Clostridium sp. E02 TaxID=2487134 RepID=UPI000F5269BA|nr:UDP-N-acetylmuramate--L-alanine ligase [Clostridium sp. E02]
MYQIDFHKPQAIHFIGIGGISMSGLAEILMDEGFTITGSDSKASALTQHLEVKGAKIDYGQKAENIREGIDVAVYTAAVHTDNPELMQAKEMGIPVLSRAELLGQMMKNYENAIAISGTHGKTTTTSMITEVLLAADSDPTISIGGILNSIGGNIRVGSSELFVTEACEYTNSFLSFYPTVEIILNIEADHLDFFKDIKEIRHSFHLFAQKLPKDGLLVINNDIESIEEIIEGLPCKVITFGKKPGSKFQADAIEFDDLARATYDLIVDDSVVDRVCLGVPGEHNVYNSLAAAAVCTELGISLELIKKGLNHFTGTNRRFEKKGEISGITIIDDYAHHPQEIKATIETAKHYPHEKLWVVFQPHTYTRTKAFLDDFAEALSLADEVILADIYAARETNDLGISSMDIVEKIEKKGGKAHYITSFDEIESFILENCIHGDLLITMGAGDIVKVGEKLLGV